MPLWQDVKVFDIQGVLSSGLATDVVVFIYLPVDVLRKDVNLRRVVYYPSMEGTDRARLTSWSA
jgi:hypothetical protein